MKKTSLILILLILSIAFSGCEHIFGYEQYTDIKDYSKIFELTEIRYKDAMMIFPRNVEELNVQNFYFEWELSLVGSASVEFLLSVEYDEIQLQEELTRLSSLADGKIIHDIRNFAFEAYVLVLGYNATNYYALIDGNTVHYVLLQIVSADEIDFDKNLLPKSYIGLGDVECESYRMVGW